MQAVIFAGLLLGSIALADEFHGVRVKRNTRNRLAIEGTYLK